MYISRSPESILPGVLQTQYEIRRFRYCYVTTI